MATFGWRVHAVDQLRFYALYAYSALAYYIENQQSPVPSLGLPITMYIKKAQQQFLGMLARDQPFEHAAPKQKSGPQSREYQ